MYSLEAREVLPSADYGIHVTRVELHAVANPTSSFCSNDSRSASEERIENQIAARRAIHNGVRYERNRLDRGMYGEQVTFVRRPGKGVGPWVVPDVAARAAESAQLDVVAIRV